MDKTSQTLREGQPKLRQQMVQLGGAAGVTAGGGTTSTSTASGVAALQQGTGCISICILVCNNLPLLLFLFFCFP